MKSHYIFTSSCWCLETYNSSGTYPKIRIFGTSSPIGVAAEISLTRALLTSHVSCTHVEVWYLTLLSLQSCKWDLRIKWCLSEAGSLILYLWVVIAHKEILHLQTSEWNLTSFRNSVRIFARWGAIPLFLFHSPGIMGGMIDKEDSSGQQSVTNLVSKNAVLIGCPR